MSLKISPKITFAFLATLNPPEKDEQIFVCADMGPLARTGAVKPVLDAAARQNGEALARPF